MNREELVLSAVIAASVALYAPVVQAQSFNSTQARAMAAAEQGPASLRHFVERTRMIHALNYAEYARPEAGVPDADITAESAGNAGSPQGDEAGAEAAVQASLAEQRAQLERDMLFE